MSKKKKKEEKIESLKELLALIAAERNCGRQSCDRCPMQKHGSCGTTKEEAIKRARELLGADNVFVKLLYGGMSETDPAQAAYDYVMALDIPDDPSFFDALLRKPAEKQESEPEIEPERLCTTCKYSTMHESGIRWCRVFGNFVHEDGFCYRWEGVSHE